MTPVRCGYSVLSGVSLAVLLAVSQAFVPAATTLTRATDGARAVVAGQQKKSLRSGTTGVTMAATRRDVLRMPSSEPMVRFTGSSSTRTRVHHTSTRTSSSLFWSCQRSFAEVSYSTCLLVGA